MFNLHSGLFSLPTPCDDWENWSDNILNKFSMNNSNSGLLDLPEELLNLIFRYCEPLWYCVIKCINKQYYSIINELNTSELNIPELIVSSPNASIFLNEFKWWKTKKLSPHLILAIGDYFEKKPQIFNDNFQWKVKLLKGIYAKRFYAANKGYCLVTVNKTCEFIFNISALAQLVNRRKSYSLNSFSRVCTFLSPCKLNVSFYTGSDKSLKIDIHSLN